jgi:hypothetical protein
LVEIVRRDVDFGEVLLPCGLLIKAAENRGANDVADARLGHDAVRRIGKNE